MSDLESFPAARRGDTIRRSFDEFRLALAFLTILPVGPPTTASSESVAESFAYFPAVGFLIGAFLAAFDWLLSFAFAPALRPVLIVLALAVVTGAIHLDALADTVDAMGAGRGRDRALEILRDSAIGSFGAVALFFALALKIVALGSIAGRQRYAAIFIAPGLARWAMVAVSYRMSYLRAQGAGSLLLSSERARNLAFASVTAIVAAGIVASANALTACGAAALIVMLMRGFYRRWLGGVTGDLIGAAGELVEIIALIAMAA